jgi:hypothetical protein
MGKAQDKPLGGGSIMPSVGRVFWITTVLLAGLAGGLAVELLRSSPAAGQAAPTGASSLYVVPGQLSRETYGLYLVDSQNSTICVYQYLVNERRLRLVAARTCLFDRQLDSYNTEPEPAEIEKLVQDARRLRTTTTRP